MADLRALLEDLGAEDVQTYVQSGNVLFRSTRSRAEVTKAVGKEIESRFGLDIALVVLTKAELARVVKANPFAAAQPDPLKLHVTFLVERPQAAKVRDL